MESMDKYFGRPVPISSRSVCLLTSDQQERKRALDRLNQRTCRAKRKTRISELEEEVKTLKKCLNDANEEVERLRRRDQSIRKVFETAHWSMQQLDRHEILHHGIEEQMQCEPAEDEFETTDTVSLHHFPGIQECQDRFSQSSATTAFSATSLGPRVQFPMEQVDAFDFLDPTQSGWEDFTLSIPFHASVTSVDGSMSSSSSPDVEPHAHFGSLDTTPQTQPRWRVVPPHTPPSCRLEQVIFQLSRPNYSPDDEPAISTPSSGANFPSIASLLNPSNPCTNADLISRGIGQHGLWMSGVVSRLPEKITCMYYMCLYIRWLREPTQSNWLSMPKHFRPTKTQQTVPHPAWIDMVVWPEARDAIIKYMDWDQFELYRMTSGAGVSVNWEAGKDFVTLKGNEIALTPEFEAHVRELGNWTAGTEVAKLFPFLDFLPAGIDNSISHGKGLI